MLEQLDIFQFIPTEQPQTLLELFESYKGKQFWYEQEKAEFDFWIEKAENKNGVIGAWGLTTKTSGCGIPIMLKEMENLSKIKEHIESYFFKDRKKALLLKWLEEIKTKEFYFNETPATFDYEIYDKDDSNGKIGWFSIISKQGGFPSQAISRNECMTYIKKEIERYLICRWGN